MCIPYGTGLSAGPGLDAAVDAKVYGRKWFLSPYVVINGVRRDIPTWLREGESPEDPWGGARAGMRPPQYSGWDVGRVLEAVAKFAADRGMIFTLVGDPGPAGVFWTALLDYGVAPYAPSLLFPMPLGSRHSNSIGEAICLAIMKV